ITAYVGVALTVFCLKSRELLLWSLDRKCVSERQHTWVEIFILGLRLMGHVFVSTAAMICNAEAMRLYTNFPVLAVLSSLLFRLLASLRIVHSGKHLKGGLFRVCFAFFCVMLAVYDDYRLDLRGLGFSIASSCLVSLAGLIPRIGLRIDNGSVHTWDCPLYMYLLTEIPPIMVTFFATCKFEGFGSAFWTVWAWDGFGLLFSLAPGGLLLVIFKCSMNTAYPFSTTAPGVLEDESLQARNAITATLQASFWVASLGVFLGEKNLVDWIQVLTFVLLYVVVAGTKQIGFYPPRLMNQFAQILRKRQQKIAREPWQLPFFLWTTISIFIALFSSSILYWNVNFAYERDAKNWVSPTAPSLDSAYVHPQPYLFDIVIAHSEGDPLSSITSLVTTFATLETILPNYPRVKLYTKDQTLNITDFSSYTGGLDVTVIAASLNNSGGVTATFLHHILYSWDSMSTQTIFLSTASPKNFVRLKERFERYFVPALPIHSERVAEPVTSFLNLGEYSTCFCSSCSDHLGWSDTFHLIPSMFGAAHQKSKPCKFTLLTHGNNFIASADRIRGLRRDVWQMLYDALTNPSLRDAWAHDRAKLPDRKDGKWIFGQDDSVQNPYLGHTIERLWGIMMQSDEREIAWRCPNTVRGWRRGGEKSDCGDLH
ncbi:hypothetical protein D0Z07_7437, partial [Hyphodiscus hymeniophilus]